ncbi:MAG: ATP-dependent DNA helicase RecG, partial [Symploca sp. SIO2G7]|nr:ATP-dependent DNA helicase RecG [Symploca sp. SIO2G7]
MKLGQLNGIGPALVHKLGTLGLRTQTDLLFHLPLRYEDRTRITPIDRVLPGQTAQIEGRVVDQQIHQGRRRSLLVVLGDHQAQVVLRFFNFYPNQLKSYAVGHRLRCYGEVRFGPEGYEMAHPQCTWLREGQNPPLPKHLTPVYPTTAGVGAARLGQLVQQALDQLQSGGLKLRDILGAPDGLPDLKVALDAVHRPKSTDAIADIIEGISPGVQRLALEELTAHHLALARLNRARAKQRAEALVENLPLVQSLLNRLEFEPTAAQRRVIDEISHDLGHPQPMRRLLQGDVGSGKTLVAAAAAAQAISAGAQVAIIAPTEILAEQHLQNFSEWFVPLGFEPVWLAGKVKGRARQQALDNIAAGAPLAIGTHALFQEGVVFKNLRLIIVDEQHRFGVHQRLALSEKGSHPDPEDTQRQYIPHQLVMTATPIPRTLAMTAYAGLEISVIDELPPGRKPVVTALIHYDRRGELIARIRQALAEGRQAYWVCPLIEESDKLEAEAAETTAADLETQLCEFRIGLLHGRMKPKNKQA